MTSFNRGGPNSSPVKRVTLLLIQFTLITQTKACLNPSSALFKVSILKSFRDFNQALIHRCEFHPVDFDVLSLTPTSLRVVASPKVLICGSVVYTTVSDN